MIALDADGASNFAVDEAGSAILRLLQQVIISDDKS